MGINKNKSKYIVILFIVISFFSEYYIYSFQNSMNMKVKRNEFLSKQTVDLNINDNIKINQIIKNKENLILMQDYEKGNCGIYIQGDKKIEIPLIEGRFIQAKDSSMDKMYAVVGKSVVEGITEKNGKKYYYYKNEYYEVIGILGDNKKDTSYDCDVYYTLNKQSIISKTVYLDAGDKSHDMAVDIQKNNNSVKEEVTNKEENMQKFIIEQGCLLISQRGKIVGIIMLNVVLIVYFWMGSRMKEIGIRRVLGASKLKITKYILSKLFIITTVSFIIGYLLYLFVTYLIYGFICFYIESLLAVYLITILIGAISCIIPIIKFNKIDLSQSIK